MLALFHADRADENRLAARVFLDDVIDDIDVLYLLRMQRERMDAALVPSLGEYSARFGLTLQRARRLKGDALVLHPGPMNRGVEILVDPVDLPGSRILEQVRAGVSARMSVLYTVLSGGSVPPMGGAE